MRTVAILALLLAAGTDAQAQWLKLPTPGIPRLPDGKPNLAAPAPRTADGKPDLSGLWRNDGGDRLYNNIAVDLKPGDVAPWADAIYQKRKLEFGKESMETQCLPMGPQYLTTKYRIFRIVQTPAMILMLFEDMVHRTIFMDGRTLESDPNPTWLGYSVGRWDGDTLVVESNGYSERVWLDFDGHPHTEALRITERYARRDFGRIDVQVSMVDPKAYPNGIRFTMPMKFQPDTEMLEFVCENHSRSRERIAKTGAEQAVVVPAATLAGHVGVYDLVDEGNGGKTVAAVTLEGGTLYLDYDAKGKEALVPLSSTKFSWSGSILEFVTRAGGPELVIHYAESDERGPRRK
ncbi:MAG TPA: hypothetical protein VFO31_25670 [Vicinamibacterales bacterium]|nr:hypothetical protein [Vicinamibacterales bacterium]